jgi:hypothetical protein
LKLKYKEIFIKEHKMMTRSEVNKIHNLFMSEFKFDLEKANIRKSLILAVKKDKAFVSAIAVVGLSRSYDIGEITLMFTISKHRDKKYSESLVKCVFELYEIIVTGADIYELSQIFYVKMGFDRIWVPQII